MGMVKDPTKRALIKSNRNLLLFSVLWIISSLSFSTRAQTLVDSSLVGRKIVAIRIHGNEKTKPSIILREMKQRVGDLLDPHLLEEDRKRIQNLNLFNRVILSAEPEEEGTHIRIVVTEQWYLFPFPVLFINERDWSKLSYGAGLTHLNFRGRAETLAFVFWLGYNPSVHLEYNNPWLGGKHHLFTRISIFTSRIRSKHFEEEDVNENHLGLQWTLGKRLGHHTFLSLTSGYREVTFSPAVEGQTLSSDGKDRLPCLGLFFTWDRRDLKEYPHTGWYIGLHVLKTGFASLTADYIRYGFDIRKYIPLVRRSTLAFRTKADLSGGTIPIYDRVYLGYNERVRGHFFETSEGENMALASVALRIPLLPVRYFNLSDNPYFSNLKFGISLGLFADTGLTWFQKEPIELSMLSTGYGLGIHIHLPYINLLRLEVAFDERGNEQLIVDLNVDI
jgi:outer membrane protein assembly factor BamA